MDSDSEQDNSTKHSQTSTLLKEPELELKLFQSQCRLHNENFDRVRQYKIACFLQTIKGFHTGELDLSGRHRARYDSIKQRWTRFSEDLAELRQWSTPSDDVDGEGFQPDFLDATLKAKSVRGYHVHNPGLLDKFDSTWCTGRTSTTIGALFAASEELLSFINDNPTPFFQTLYLSDLPNELIDRIMQLSYVKDIRALSTTCRWLREISWPFVYREVSLIYRTKNYRVTSNVLSFGEAKEQFIERSVVYSQPRVIKLIRKISISCYDLPNPSVDPCLHHTHGLDIIAETIRVILESASELESLCITFFPLPFHVAKTILTSPKLRTLYIASCPPLFSLNDTSQLPLSHSIANMDLSIYDTRDWWLSKYMPNLRVVSARDAGYSGVCLPPETIMRIVNPFKTIQQYSHVYLSPPELSELISWIELANPGGTPCITHFKISGSWNEDHISLMLRALRGAPMESFVLESIQSDMIRPALLDRLADAFPQLTSLSLQSEGIEGRWPCPLSEYVASFKGFGGLKHIGWNHLVRPGTDHLEFVYALRDPPREMISKNLIGAFEDVEAAAKVLAAGLPSLETISFSNRNIPILDFRIKRRESGDVVLAIEDMRECWQRARSHNPCIFEKDKWDEL